MEIFGYTYSMNNVIVLYWQPGSGGDTVQQMLSMDPRFQTIIEKFNLNDQGRTTATVLPWFINNFSHAAGQWLWRSWSESDLDVLSTWPDIKSGTTLILPTHSAEQASWLKANISGSRVAAITYPNSMYHCVLTNWCKKVAADDPAVIKNYQSRLHKNLKDNGQLGVVIMKDQLEFGSNLLSTVLPEWDINISLERLLIGDARILQTIGLDINLSQSVLDFWVQKQKRLYKNQWPISEPLRQALGYNSLAPDQSDADLTLDQYDKILIKSWCKRHMISVQDATMSTLAQADSWLENVVLDPMYDN